MKIATRGNVYQVLQFYYKKLGKEKMIKVLKSFLNAIDK